MTDVLVCPVCTTDVSSRSAMCRGCHLPIGDVAANQPRETGAADRLRWLGRRVIGLAIYAAAVTWCWMQLREAMVFVGPGAAVAAWLHVVKGRPWLGLVAFVIVVGLAPFLFWPALGTDIISDVSGLVD